MGQHRRSLKNRFPCRLIPASEGSTVSGTSLVSIFTEGSSKDCILIGTGVKGTLVNRINSEGGGPWNWIRAPGGTVCRVKGILRSCWCGPKALDGWPRMTSLLPWIRPLDAGSVPSLQSSRSLSGSSVLMMPSLMATRFLPSPPFAASLMTSSASNLPFFSLPRRQSRVGPGPSTLASLEALWPASTGLPVPADRSKPGPGSCFSALTCSARGCTGCSSGLQGAPSDAGGGGGSSSSSGLSCSSLAGEGEATTPSSRAWGSGGPGGSSNTCSDLTCSSRRAAGCTLDDWASPHDEATVVTAAAHGVGGDAGRSAPAALKEVPSTGSWGGAGRSGRGGVARGSWRNWSGGSGLALSMGGGGDDAPAWSQPGLWAQPFVGDLPLSPFG